MRYERGPRSSRSQSARSTKLSSARRCAGGFSFGVAARGTSVGGVAMRGAAFGDGALPFVRRKGLTALRSAGRSWRSGVFGFLGFGRVIRSDSTSFGFIGFGGVL